jgi:thioredoxin reductase (NADPH)
MCPDVVRSAQRIAAENPYIRAHVYDLRHFEELKNRHKVMSVPCLVVNDEQVYFGKKNMDQLLDLLGSG